MSKLKDLNKKTGLKQLLKKPFEHFLKLIQEVSVKFEPSCEQFVTVCHISTLQDTIANWNKGGYMVRSIVVKNDTDECVILLDRGRQDG